MNTICESNTSLNYAPRAGATDLDCEPAARPDAPPWYFVHWSLLTVLGAALALLVGLLTRPVLADAIATRFL